MTEQQRTPQGQFRRGGPGGPGRPRRQTEAGYLEVLMGACDLDAWRNVVERAVEDAQGGDDKACAWLASYLVGKPEAAAPAPTAVVVNALLNFDPALDAAAKRRAKPEIDRIMFPILFEDEDRANEIQAEAAEAIRAAEAEAAAATEVPSSRPRASPGN